METINKRVSFQSHWLSLRASTKHKIRLKQNTQPLTPAPYKSLNQYKQTYQHWRNSFIWPVKHGRTRWKATTISRRRGFSDLVWIDRCWLASTQTSLTRFIAISTWNIPWKFNIDSFYTIVFISVVATAPVVVTHAYAPIIPNSQERHNGILFGLLPRQPTFVISTFVKKSKCISQAHRHVCGADLEVQ